MIAISPSPVHVGNENCASVWGFSYNSAAENVMSINDADSVA